MPKIGYLGWAEGNAAGSRSCFGLRELGYRPGETITIECRTAGSHDSGLAPAAAELVKLGVDVIVTDTQPAGEPRTK